MKNFSSLTVEQQQKALAFAQKELEDALSLGIVVVGVKLSGVEIAKLAKVAAEEGDYDDEGNPVMAGMDVPSYFLGGCV